MEIISVPILYLIQFKDQVDQLRKNIVPTKKPKKINNGKLSEELQEFFLLLVFSMSLLFII